jgi:phage baseplate assembly protein W
MTQRAISLPFSFGSSGEVAFTTDNKKMWQDRVVLVVMTRLRERIMRPGFGTNIQDFTFESVDEAMAHIQQAIAIGFSNYLPSLQLTDVVGKIDSLDGNLNLEIYYKINTDDSDLVTIKTAIISRSGDIIQEIPNGK